MTDRLVGRVRITTDNNQAYLNVVESNIAKSARYLGATPRANPAHSNTSYVSKPNRKRQRLNLQMRNCQLTQLKSAFSWKAVNLACSLALDFFYYNFCCVHQTLGMTPAMKAGIAEHPMKIEDLVEILPPPAAKA